MCRNVCLAAALWAALWGTAISPPEVRCQETRESLPAAGGPSSSIASDCKAKLEYARIPAAERPLSELGACVYDFLSFIDAAGLIRTRGQDGFMKQSIPFFDAHMARYTAALEAELWRRFPGEDEFARRHRVRAREKALHRESALVRDYIGRSRDRRRYYVDGVQVIFHLEGPYDFDNQTYRIDARVICGQKPKVFYGLCNLQVRDIPLTFTLSIDPAGAEQISRKQGEQRIDIPRQFWVVPDLQGVYDPSWLFRGTRYVATARLDVGQAFIEEVEMRVKKWYFLSE